MSSRCAAGIESWKREAKVTYEGGSGYQPVLGLWAEMNVVVAEEFRDGHVPAQQELLPLAKRAFAALPGTVEERYFRGDAAGTVLLSIRRRDKDEAGEGREFGLILLLLIPISARPSLPMLPHPRQPEGAL